MIHYTASLDGIAPTQLAGFFEEWPNPPSPETHLRLLAGSDLVALAVDDAATTVAGFATAITDGVLSAYIPLLEVKPAYRGQGIGHALVRDLLHRLGECYMVDLLCDPDLEAFYAPLGLRPAFAMAIRRYDRQSSKPALAAPPGHSGGIS